MKFIGGTIPFILMILFFVSLPACGQTLSPASSTASPSQVAKDDVKSEADSPAVSQSELVIVGYDYAGRHGSSKATRIDISQVKEARPLPTGYTLFNNIAYRVETEAIVLGHFFVTFKVLQAENREEFNKLRILHLKGDELSPTGWSWEDCTILLDKRKEGDTNATSNEKPERRAPDFAGRTISCRTSEVGVFVIALKEESQAEALRAFTKIHVSTVSSPDVLAVGENVTYTITIANEGPMSAGEVNLENTLETGLVYISATSSHGTCRQSSFSSGRTICNLGPLPAGASASINIVALFERNVTAKGRGVQNTSSVVFKKNPTDFTSGVNATQTAITSAIR